MASYIPSDSPVFERFFTPVVEQYAASSNQYDCKVIGDLNFLEIGVVRCLSESTTGRDMLQRHGDHGRFKADVDLFFKALKSERRISNLQSINELLRSVVRDAVADPYTDIPELSKFEIFSGDGHFHEGAAHDTRVDTENGGRRKPATGHFFMIDQRSHYMSHLTVAEVSEDRRREHDMHAIERLPIDQLRGNTPKGRKVILVWDRAGVDIDFWRKAKQAAGLYFISQEKTNMVFTAQDNLEFDRNDPRNAGVIADEKGTFATNNTVIRRITYVDPVSGKVFKYLTTEMTLPPGIISLLYKQRWDIEKVFDEYKNKLDEQKSWGSGEQSKTSHALFLCLTHNLMLIIEAMLRDLGIDNYGELDRREIRRKLALENNANFVATFAQRCTVRSVKFIRWLRNHTYQQLSWSTATSRLIEVYADF